MKPAVFAVLLFGAASLLLGQAARAQSPLPIRVKIGDLLPTDNGTRNTTGRNIFMAEADLDLPLPGVTGRTFFSIGYGESSKGGQHLRVVPVTIGRTFSPPNPASGLTGNVYVGAGIGLYYLRVSGNGLSGNKVQPGGFGVLGYQFPSKTLVEVKYHLTGSVSGQSPRGIAFLIGQRF